MTLGFPCLNPYLAFEDFAKVISTLEFIWFGFFCTWNNILRRLPKRLGHNAVK